MPQFLFVVEIPEGPAMSSQPSYSHEWTQFAREANTMLKPVKACKRLPPNAWLIPAENNLPLLMELVSLASTGSLSYSSVLIPDGAVTLALDIKPKS